MAILAGKATLEIHPVPPFGALTTSRAEYFAAVVGCLVEASPFVLSITVGCNFPEVTVDVAIPLEPGFELRALQRELTDRVTQMLAELGKQRAGERAA